MSKKLSTPKFFLVLIGLVIFGFLINHFYWKPKYINGEVAPDFSSISPDGQPFQFYDLKGHYILLDFWGSWCGPCRQENPEIVKLYNKYEQTKFVDAKGFTVVSVGVEREKNRWIKAIEKDGLRWPHHVSELKRLNSSEVKLYGVKEIPTKYLISPEMMIIGVNQPLGEIDRYLSSKISN